MKKGKILNKLNDADVELSNLDEYFEIYLRICSNSRFYEHLRNSTKEEVLYLLFPVGNYYDREKEEYQINGVASS